MKSELTSIKKPNFAKRILAIIMDGAVTLFVFFAFFLFVFRPIANVAFGMNDTINKGTNLQLDSGLYVLTDEEKQTYTLLNKCDFASADEYKVHLKTYYVEFKTQKAPDKDTLIKDEHGNDILPKDYYTESWFNDKMTDVVTVEQAKNASLDALSDFSKYLTPVLKKINRCKLFITFSSYTMSFGIFLILIPLLFKNGETLGKKTMGLGLVSKDGYDVKKRQIVLRQLFLFVYVGAFSLYVGIGFTSFALLGLGVLIYFVAAFIIKDNRSFADLLSYTRVIDAKNSVWFKDPEEEKQKRKIVEENLEKYNKITEPDKHILQVGGEIVDEMTKKEIEDNKNKK